MAIMDSIRRFFGGEAPPTTTSETKPPFMPSLLMQRFAAETERRRVVQICRQMYKTDPRAEGVLRMLARDATKGGYQLQIEDGPLAARAQQVTDLLDARLMLNERLADWTRLAARDGDSFLELGITRSREIAEITRKPSLQMRRNDNDFGRFENPAEAFVWADESYLNLMTVADAVYFPEFTIVHARWNHDEDERYGTPEFASANGVWKRVTEGELDIAIRRKTRAGLKYNHKFPEGTSSTVITQYMEINKDALDNPFAAVADFFGSVDIQAIGGDARLAEIGDVEHHIQTWSASSPVPLELLAYGENLNRDVLSEKKEQYDETLDDVRQWVASQILLPIYERQWLLAGIMPEGLTYSIGWQTKKQVTAQDMSTLADAALRFRALGWPDDMIWQTLGAMLPPGVDIQALLADMAADRENPERLAAAAGLGGNNDSRG